MKSVQYLILSLVAVIPTTLSQSESSVDCSTLAKAFINHNFDGSNCPQESWMEVFRAVDPNPSKNMINIGFNKGYNFA